MASLPETNFHLYTPNPIEKIFWGRLPLNNATSQYYFTKESLIQFLMHQIKYKGNQELNFFMGKLMGLSLQQSNRFKNINALIPLPLHPAKEKRRGYNQATLLCKGMSDILGIPTIENAVIRSQFTDTQTKKARIERWQNMEGKFRLNNIDPIANRHVLLVDDVITTGATLEACGLELLKVPGVQLSIASLCYSSK